MTPQEIFDTVARHLFTQGERAGREIKDGLGDAVDFECLYRGPNNGTCAVGKLLPDACYDPCMEGDSVTGVCEAYGAGLPNWMHENLGLLIRLQNVHDVEHNWKGDVDMKFALGIAADKFGLDKSILDGLSFNRAEA